MNSVLLIIRRHSIFMLALCLFWIAMFALGYDRTQQFQHLRQRLYRQQQNLVAIQSAYQRTYHQHLEYPAMNHAFIDIEEQQENIASHQIHFSDQMYQINQQFPLQKLVWQYEPAIAYSSSHIPKNKFYELHFIPVKLDLLTQDEHTNIDLIARINRLGRYYQFNNCEMTAQRESASRAATKTVIALHSICHINLPVIKTIPQHNVSRTTFQQ